MKNELGSLFIRVKDILKTEGLISLLRRGFGFLALLLFDYGTYYLYLRNI